MAGETIAHGEVRIDLNDDAVVAGLRRIDREFERTVRDIDHTRATATAELDTAPFDDAVKQAKRELRVLKGERATVTIEADKKELDKKIAAARKEIAKLEGEKATVEFVTKGEESVRKAQEAIRKANEREQQAIEKQQRDRQRIYDQASARRIAQVRNEARVSAALSRQREKELASAHSWALKINQDMDRAEAQRKKELDSVPRLQREYAELARKLELLAQARRKARGDDTAKLTIDFKIAEAEAKMRALHSTLERIGSPVKIDVDIRPGRKFGATIRDEFRRGGVTSAAFVFGAGIGDRIVRGMKSTLSPKAIGGAVTDTLGKIGHALGNLSEATVRLGPFTATIRQTILALSLLGPTILDLVGALGSLIGVLGTGLTGAAALATGAIGAFGITFGGLFALVRSSFRDFKNLNTLQDAYHKQVLKTGENSDKAKTKLKEFNHALGEVQPTTRRAFLSIDKLQDRWRELVKTVKPQFFDAVGQALQTVNAHFDWFTNNTREAFGILTGGWEKWMEGLRGPEATRILHNLGQAGNDSLAPLMHALGNIVTMFGRIAESSARFLPQMIRGFDNWTEKLKDSDAITTNLDSNINRLVEHAKLLGQFFMAAGRFIISFFDAGANAGADFLVTMTNALNSWAEFNRSVGGRQKLQEFFQRSVRGAQALYNAIAPIVVSFVQWAQNMSPVVNQFFTGVSAVSQFVGQLLRLTGLQNSVSSLVTTLGALWAVSRIRAATRAIQGFGGAILGVRGAGMAAGATSGVGAGVAAGAAGGAATRTMSAAIRSSALAAVRGAGLLGVGVLVMTLIGKGMGTFADRGGFKSTVLGLSRDVLSTFSFGLIHSADEASKSAAQKVVGALRNNINLELNKNRALGGGTRTIDLKVDDKKVALNFQRALQAADRIAREHHLPSLSLAVKVKSNPQDFNTIKQNWDRLKNNLATTNASIERNTEQTLQAMRNTMDLNSSQGRTAVEHNMQLTANAILNNMRAGGTGARQGMTEIHHQFVVHSQASRRATDVNFSLAKDAIAAAVQGGIISSRRGLSEIRKLWEENLKLYGFTASQARNIAKGNSYTGGPEEGTRGPGRSGTVQKKAVGGLVQVGRKGQSGRDDVPAMLGGRPAVVAKGEQIAVFNRHQQKAMNSMLPGGLEGFFAGNKRPHYMAGGGIVPVPGFPGERAAASILDEIAMVHNRFGLTLTDAYGQGHKSPGHTVTGTAADFAGPDRAMDAAVKALVGMGYLVGYDGRFGSQKWPGHGPSYVAGSNAHLHVEFGSNTGVSGAGAAISAPALEKQMVAQGLGAVTTLTQAAVDLVTNAAQQNLDAVAAQSLSIATAGGGGGGKYSEGQVRAWIAAGLRLAGLSAGGGNVDTLYGRVMQESGGDPHAINLWDSNAKAGHPSKGFLQTIDSTFQRYMVPGHGDIWNPIDNTAAAVRYMMATYGHLVGRSGSGYAMGGIVPMGPEAWARGGMIDRPTLLTGEDKGKHPEFVIGTNPAYRKTNLQALTGAANKLGVHMARKSKTGTVKPSLVRGGGDADKLKEVQRYKEVQGQEDDKRREISIAESKVKEPDTLVKQQGTDAAGNPIYVVDQTKVDAYAAQMAAVKNLYDNLIDKVMVRLRNAAQNAYAALDKYRANRNQNIDHLDNQNAINKRLMKSKDKDTREAAKRRYEAGVQLRDDEVAKRTDAAGVKADIQQDQHDAAYRTQEYQISRASVIEDITGLGAKAAAEAASETKSAYNEPDAVTAPPTPGETAISGLETERALAAIGIGVNGQPPRALKDIIADLVTAETTRLNEGLALLNDADTSNDEEARQIVQEAAQAIQSLNEELNNLPDSQAGIIRQQTALSTAISDLYKGFTNNFAPIVAGLSGGVAAQGARATAALGGSGALGINAAMAPAMAGVAGGAPINITQNFPTQPDPMTWARSTKYEITAAL